jgi:hypothetical protein
MNKVALLGLLLAALTPVYARIEYAHVYYDDRALIEITQPFGFGSRGHIDIVLRDISIWRRHDSEDDYKLGNFGFFLANINSASSSVTQEMLSQACLLEERDLLKLFTFADPKVEAVIDGKAPNVTFHVEVKDGGLFSVFFANCEQRTPVSFAMKVSAYNLVGPQGRKDYLSIGEGELDVMYWVSSSSSSSSNFAQHHDWVLVCKAAEPSGAANVSSNVCRKQFHSRGSS